MHDHKGSNDEVVRLTGIRHAYREAGRDRLVLNDIALTIRRGESLALVGRSGSGKSTLLNLVAGIDYPSAGEIEIDARRLTRMDERGRTLFRRRHIGFVYQFFNLLPTLSVEENLLLPLELNAIRGSAARERARHLLHRVGLGDRRDSFPDRLSGGEQQRVAIARALVHRPSLVLADEPTGNLDAETGRQILALLDELVRGAGNTLLLVTHSDEVAGIADQIRRLERGSLHAVSAAQ